VIALHLFKKHRDARLAKMKVEIDAFERSSQKMIEALEGLTSAHEKLKATIAGLEARGIIDKRKGDQ
jgi:hypothetical protein